MFENTSTPNEVDDTDIVCNLEELNGMQIRKNAEAVSSIPTEEHCAFYIWDNYLVQSFRYEFGVYTQLQGTGFVLNNGSEYCRNSALRNPKRSKNKKNSFACQIYHKMRQKPICEICDRPTIFCKCRGLDPMRSMRRSINNQEKKCCFCKNLCTECESEKLLEFSRSIMDNTSSAVVYLLQNEEGKPVFRSSSKEPMRNRVMHTCKIPIRCNYITSSRAVRCSKFQQTPLFRSGESKLTYISQGDETTDVCKFRHCVNCVRPLSRCVCKNLKTGQRTGDKFDYSGRIPLPTTYGKLNNFSEKDNLGSVRKTPNEGCQLTRIIGGKRERPETLSQISRKSFKVSGKSSEAHKVIKAIIINGDHEQKYYNEIENLLKTDKGRKCISVEEGTDMETNFLIITADGCSEKKQNDSDNDNKGQKTEVSTVPNIPFTPSFRSGVAEVIEEKIVKSTEQLTKEGIIIEKALKDMNIIVTIRKQPEDSFSSILTKEASASKMIEGLDRESEFESFLEQENLQLPFVLTMSKELNSLSKSVSKEKYSCTEIQTDRFMINKLLLQSMNEVEKVLVAPESVKRIVEKVKSDPSTDSVTSRKSENIARRQNEQNEKVLLHKRFRYSSKNGWISEMNNVSTELSDALQEANDGNNKLLCSLGEISKKPSNSSLVKNNDNSFDKANIDGKTIDGENIDLSLFNQNDSIQMLLPTTKTNPENEQFLKTSDNGHEKADISHTHTASHEDSRKFSNNHLQCMKKYNDYTPKSQQCQTGGTLQQDLIASFVTNCSLNPKIAMSRQCIIPTLFHHFAGYDSDKRFDPLYLGKSVEPPNRRNNAQSVKFCTSIRSIKTQAGSSYPPKCKETQTVTTFVISEPNSGPSRSFRKKFNYICSPDSPGFKTKISMNLDQLLEVDDTNMTYPMETDDIEGQTEQMENKTSSFHKKYLEAKETELEKRHYTTAKKNKNNSITGTSLRRYPHQPNLNIAVKTPEGRIERPDDYENTHLERERYRKKNQRNAYVSTKLRKFREQSLKSKEPGSYRIDEDEEQLQNVKKCGFRSKLKRQFEKHSDNRNNEYNDFKIPYEKFKKNENVSVASEYSSRMISGTMQTDRKFQESIRNAPKKNLVITGCDTSRDVEVPKKRIQKKYWLKPNTAEDGYDISEMPDVDDYIITTRNRRVPKEYIDVECSLRNIEDNEELYTYGIPLNASKNAKYANEVHRKKNVETEFDPNDLLALESAMDQFIEINGKTETFE